MGKKLLIVESPAKAKTIGKYLGGEFTVKSSVGHVRDLPSEGGAIKIEPKGEGKWSFTPTYVVPKAKAKVVSELKSAASGCDEIYLASDPDREGEAIAWHLREILKGVAKGKPFHRVSYNEITKGAVLKAVSEPRDIDMPRVDAQQARRILDRLVGYKVSPLLWKYIPCRNSKTLSAGRVQSVALRLLVERQREIDAFTPEKYYVLGVEAAKAGHAPFAAKLSRLDGEKPDIREKAKSDNLLLDLSGSELEVAGVAEQPKTRRPLPPFTTSTLQQAASSVLKFSPGKTMKTAQKLYELGLITYMRTDSVNVSDLARAAAKDYVEREFGAEFYPAKPNVYRSKADAQGAHEAIRPTDVASGPSGAGGLESAEARLYELVWRRFVASQMREAKTVVRTVSLKPSKPSLAHSYVFTASATRIDFEGFLKVMKLAAPKKAGEDGGDDDSDEVKSLPPLEKGETLSAARWLLDEKETKGPSHYSEASLVKALEENGVGRPSTYAATIETLKAREYAKTEKGRITPLERGTMVCDWLVKKLDALFNVGYTAEMESELDKVEEKGEPMDAMLSAFYARFSKALEACAEPSPDASKFDLVFSLLSEVKTWKEPKTIGRRTYDDKAFVESVLRQRDAGRPLSARQLDFLVRMVTMYSSQIADAEARLRDGGLGVAAARREESRADEAMAKLCFDTIDRLGGLPGNIFVRSLREQFDHGKTLTPRQFTVLARTVAENASGLEDWPEIRAKLGVSATEVPEDSSTVSDPAIPKLLETMHGVKQWRPPSRNGKRRYDDKQFIASLTTQYERRKTLTKRQLSALRHMVVAYKDRIDGFDELAPQMGLEDFIDGDGDGKEKGGARGVRA